MRPSQGSITFEGRPIAGSAPHRLARQGIAWVPEDRRIFRLLSVQENLRVGLDRGGVTEARKKELLERVFESFPRLRERRGSRAARSPGASSRCSPSRAP